MEHLWWCTSNRFRTVLDQKRRCRRSSTDERRSPPTTIHTCILTCPGGESRGQRANHLRAHARAHVQARTCAHDARMHSELSARAHATRVVCPHPHARVAVVCGSALAATPALAPRQVRLQLRRVGPIEDRLRARRAAPRPADWWADRLALRLAGWLAGLTAIRARVIGWAVSAQS